MKLQLSAIVIEARPSSAILFASHRVTLHRGLSLRFVVTLVAYTLFDTCVSHYIVSVAAFAVEGIYPFLSLATVFRYTFTVAVTGTTVCGGYRYCLQQLPLLLPVTVHERSNKSGRVLTRRAC